MSENVENVGFTEALHELGCNPYVYRMLASYKCCGDGEDSVCALRQGMKKGALTGLVVPHSVVFYADGSVDWFHSSADNSSVHTAPKNSVTVGNLYRCFVKHRGLMPLNQRNSTRTLLNKNLSKIHSEMQRVQGTHAGMGVSLDENCGCGLRDVCEASAPMGSERKRKLRSVRKKKSEPSSHPVTSEAEGNLLARFLQKPNDPMNGRKYPIMAVNALVNAHGNSESVLENAPARGRGEHTGAVGRNDMVRAHPSSRASMLPSAPARIQGLPSKIHNHSGFPSTNNYHHMRRPAQQSPPQTTTHIPQGQTILINDVNSSYVTAFPRKSVACSRPGASGKLVGIPVVPERPNHFTTPSPGDAGKGYTPSTSGPVERHNHQPSLVQHAPPQGLLSYEPPQHSVGQLIKHTPQHVPADRLAHSGFNYSDSPPEENSASPTKSYPAPSKLLCPPSSEQRGVMYPGDFMERKYVPAPPSKHASVIRRMIPLRPQNVSSQRSSYKPGTNLFEVIVPTQDKYSRVRQVWHDDEHAMPPANPPMPPVLTPPPPEPAQQHTLSRTRTHPPEQLCAVFQMASGVLRQNCRRQRSDLCTSDCHNTQPQEQLCNLNGMAFADASNHSYTPLHIPRAFLTSRMLYHMLKIKQVSLLWPQLCVFMDNNLGHNVDLRGIVARNLSDSQPLGSFDPLLTSSVGVCTAYPKFAHTVVDLCMARCHLRMKCTHNDGDCDEKSSSDCAICASVWNPYACPLVGVLRSFTFAGYPMFGHAGGYKCHIAPPVNREDMKLTWPSPFIARTHSHDTLTLSDSDDSASRITSIHTHDRTRFRCVINTCPYMMGTGSLAHRYRWRLETARDLHTAEIHDPRDQDPEAAAGEYLMGAAVSDQHPHHHRLSWLVDRICSHLSRVMTQRVHDVIGDSQANPQTIKVSEGILWLQRDIGDRVCLDSTTNLRYTMPGPLLRALRTRNGSETDSGGQYCWCSSVDREHPQHPHSPVRTPVVHISSQSSPISPTRTVQDISSPEELVEVCGLCIETLLPDSASPENRSRSRVCWCNGCVSRFFGACAMQYAHVSTQFDPRNGPEMFEIPVDDHAIHKPVVTTSRRRKAAKKHRKRTTENAPSRSHRRRLKHSNPAKTAKLGVGSGRRGVWRSPGYRTVSNHQPNVGGGGLSGREGALRAVLRPATKKPKKRTHPRPSHNVNPPLSAVGASVTGANRAPNNAKNSAPFNANEAGVLSGEDMDLLFARDMAPLMIPGTRSTTMSAERMRTNASDSKVHSKGRKRRKVSSKKTRGGKSRKTKSHKSKNSRKRRASSRKKQSSNIGSRLRSQHHSMKKKGEALDESSRIGSGWRGCRLPHSKSFTFTQMGFFTMLSSHKFQQNVVRSSGEDFSRLGYTYGSYDKSKEEKKRKVSRKERMRHIRQLATPRNTVIPNAKTATNPLEGRPAWGSPRKHRRSTTDLPSLRGSRAFVFPHRKRSTVSSLSDTDMSDTDPENILDACEETATSAEGASSVIEAVRDGASSQSLAGQSSGSGGSQLRQSDAGADAAEAGGERPRSIDYQGHTQTSSHFERDYQHMLLHPETPDISAGDGSDGNSSECDPTSVHNQGTGVDGVNEDGGKDLPSGVIGDTNGGNVDSGTEHGGSRYRREYQNPRALLSPESDDLGSPMAAEDHSEHSMITPRNAQISDQSARESANNRAIAECVEEDMAGRAGDSKALLDEKCASVQEETENEGRTSIEGTLDPLNNSTGGGGTAQSAISSQHSEPSDNADASDTHSPDPQNAHIQSPVSERRYSNREINAVESCHSDPEHGYIGWSDTSSHSSVQSSRQDTAQDADDADANAGDAGANAGDAGAHVVSTGNSGTDQHNNSPLSSKDQGSAHDIDEYGGEFSEDTAQTSESTHSPPTEGSIAVSIGEETIFDDQHSEDDQNNSESQASSHRDSAVDSAGDNVSVRSNPSQYLNASQYSPNNGSVSPRSEDSFDESTYRELVAETSDGELLEGNDAPSNSDVAADKNSPEADIPDVNSAGEVIVESDERIGSEDERHEGGFEDLQMVEGHADMYDNQVSSGPTESLGVIEEIKDEVSSHVDEFQEIEVASGVTNGSYAGGSMDHGAVISQYLDTHAAATSKPQEKTLMEDDIAGYEPLKASPSEVSEALEVISNVSSVHDEFATVVVDDKTLLEEVQENEAFEVLQVSAHRGIDDADVQEYAGVDTGVPIAEVTNTADNALQSPHDVASVGSDNAPHNDESVGSGNEEPDVLAQAVDMMDALAITRTNSDPPVAEDLHESDIVRQNLEQPRDLPGVAEDPKEPDVLQEAEDMLAHYFDAGLDGENDLNVQDAGSGHSDVEAYSGVEDVDGSSRVSSFGPNRDEPGSEVALDDELEYPMPRSPLKPLESTSETDKLLHETSDDAHHDDDMLSEPTGGGALQTIASVSKDGYLSDTHGPDKSQESSESHEHESSLVEESASPTDHSDNELLDDTIESLVNSDIGALNSSPLKPLSLMGDSTHNTVSLVAASNAHTETPERSPVTRAWSKSTLPSLNELENGTVTSLSSQENDISVIKSPDQDVSLTLPHENLADSSSDQIDRIATPEVVSSSSDDDSPRVGLQATRASRLPALTSLPSIPDIAHTSEPDYNEAPSVDDSVNMTSESVASLHNVHENDAPHVSSSSDDDIPPYLPDDAGGLRGLPALPRLPVIPGIDNSVAVENTLDALRIENNSDSLPVGDNSDAIAVENSSDPLLTENTSNPTEEKYVSGLGAIENTVETVSVLDNAQFGGGVVVNNDVILPDTLDEDSSSSEEEEAFLAEQQLIAPLVVSAQPDMELPAGGDETSEDEELAQLEAAFSADAGEMAENTFNVSSEVLVDDDEILSERAAAPTPPTALHEQVVDETSSASSDEAQVHVMSSFGAGVTGNDWNDDEFNF